MSWVTWTVTLVTYAGAFLASCWWTHVELKKRRQNVRIVTFSRDGKMHHVRDWTSNEKNSNQNNKGTLFLEQSLHRCSIAVYIASIIGCLTGILKHMTVFCSFISQIQTTSFAFSKIFILIFQMKRYELSFKKTRKKYCIDMFALFYGATIISGSFACVMTWIFTKRLILNNYCTWDATNNLFVLIPISFSVLDLFILGLFTHKILSLSKTLCQIKQQHEIPSVDVDVDVNISVNVKDKDMGSQSELGVKSISSESSDAIVKQSELAIEKLHKILKRLLILSLAMEFLYLLTLVSEVTFARTGSQFSFFVTLWNGLDMATNIKFISLMLQHNTELSFNFAVFTLQYCYV